MADSLTLPLPSSVHRITTEEEVVKLTEVLALAFTDSGPTRWFLMGNESRPNHPKLERFDLLMQFWLPGIKARFETGGVLAQSHDYAGAAVWLPPGIQKPEANANTNDPPPEGLIEMRAKMEVIKKEHLRDRPHWYLNLIGRSPTRDDKGAIRNLIEPFLKKAQEDGVPAWVEASGTHARDVYMHFGFRVVGHIRIGEGVVNKEGFVQEGGEGIVLWGMIAEP